jgi:hypothetical protein
MTLWPLPNQKGSDEAASGKCQRRERNKRFVYCSFRQDKIAIGAGTAKRNFHT